MKRIFFLWFFVLSFMCVFAVCSYGAETVQLTPIADGTDHFTCEQCMQTHVPNAGENCEDNLELDGYKTGETIHEFRPVIEFDISGLSGQLANYASLQVERASGSNPTDIKVFMYEGNGTLIPVSTFYIYPVTKNASLGEEIDVTEMLNFGISKGYSAVGFFLKWHRHGGQYSYCCIASSESLNPPILTVEYETTVVEMSSFKAIPSDKQVKVEWKTEAEIDNAGFNVWRAEGFKQINESMITGKGSPALGSEYDFVDNFVLNRKNYFYLIEDVDIYGISTFHGPVKATPRLIHGIGK